MNVIVVLQARMGSKRLPGKALADLAECSVLAHCVDRLRASGVGPVVLATTVAPEDEALVAEGARLRIPVVRGSGPDVLHRFAEVARDTQADLVIRATADNPAVDIDAPRRTLDALRRSAGDYCFEQGLPVGAAVEAMTAIALVDAERRASDESDREHVTSYLRRRGGRYRVVELMAPAHVHRPELRLTIDHPSDLQFLRLVAGRLAAPLGQAPLVSVIAAADRVLAEAQAV